MNNKIIDYTYWDEYEGASEGSGRSDKIWLINKSTKEIGLFKYTKSHETTEHISEKLASDIAKLLGIKCAKIEIGKYNFEIGSMSYLINKNDEILIEGIYLINEMYPFYNSYTMYDSMKEEYYSLEMILNSLDKYNLKKEFFKIIIFDYLIGNTDRHQNNWAIIQKGEDVKLCPIYDNGSSLCCYLKEENIATYLGNDKVRFNSLVNTKSKSRIRIDKKSKKEPTHLEVIKYIKENYNDYIKDFIDIVIKYISKENIDKIINNYDDGLISSNRKELIRRFLLEKVRLIKELF